MKDFFDDSETEAILLVDASNAFNSINFQAALHNAQVICPPLYQILLNTCHSEVRMIIPLGGEILSSEGTTQGDPLAMSMYALAVVPLIHDLKSRISEVNQVWFADDATGAGTCASLRAWWDSLSLSMVTIPILPRPFCWLSLLLNVWQGKCLLVPMCQLMENTI